MDNLKLHGPSFFDFSGGLKIIDAYTHESEYLPWLDNVDSSWKETLGISVQSYYICICLDSQEEVERSKRANWCR